MAGLTLHLFGPPRLARAGVPVCDARAYGLRPEVHRGFLDEDVVAPLLPAGPAPHGLLEAGSAAPPTACT